MSSGFFRSKTPEPPNPEGDPTQRQSPAPEPSTTIKRANAATSEDLKKAAKQLPKAKTTAPQPRTP